MTLVLCPWLWIKVIWGIFRWIALLNVRCFMILSRHDTNSIDITKMTWSCGQPNLPCTLQTWSGLLLLVAQGSRWLCEGQSFATCEEVSVPGSRMAAVLGGMYLGPMKKHGGLSTKNIYKYGHMFFWRGETQLSYLIISFYVLYMNWYIDSYSHVKLWKVP